MNKNKLTPERVKEIFEGCIPKSGLPKTKLIQVEGPLSGDTFLFDGDQIKKYETDIKEMLSQLPCDFKHSTGFFYLNLGVTDEGDLWTLNPLGDDERMLYLLGRSLKKIFIIGEGTDKESRGSGGYPYIQILD